MSDQKNVVLRTMRLVVAIVTVAAMWVPATALADDASAELEVEVGPLAPGTTTVIPLLGATINVEVTTDGGGAITGITVDGTPLLDFESEDDEVEFLFTYPDGSTLEVEIEFGDADDEGESEDADDESEDDDDSDEDESEDDDDSDDDESEDDDESDEDDDDSDEDD